MMLKILDLIFNHGYSFRGQFSFHFIGLRKVHFTGQQAVSVYHTVSGDIQEFMACVHGPSHHSCAAFRTQGFCNGAIRSNPSLGYQANYLINCLKEILILGHCTKLRNERNLYGFTSIGSYFSCSCFSNKSLSNGTSWLLLPASSVRFILFSRNKKSRTGRLSTIPQGILFFAAIFHALASDPFPVFIVM